MSDTRWTLTQHRLALGIEPRDAVRRTGMTRSVRLETERAQGSKRVLAHEGGRYAILFTPTVPVLPASLRLRFVDPTRRWIPRRIDVGVPDPTDTISGRRLEPFLFPGVAWDLGGGMTALRGFVHRDGDPVRWAWVEGRLADEADIIIRTRADDRGEFLLVLGPHTVSLSELPGTGELEIDLRAYGPDPTPVPPPDPGDPLWDLPVDTLSLGTPDTAAEPIGQTLPPGWAPSTVDQRVTLELGRTTTQGVLAFSP